MKTSLHFLSFLAMVLGGAVAHSTRPLLDIPLRYEKDAVPEDDHRSAWNPALTRRSCRLMPVVDERKTIGSKEIGYSEVEQEKVTTSSDVPRFVGESLVRIFDRFGLKLASDGDVRLHVGLRELHALEENTYLGRATLRYTAIDAKGDTLVNYVTTGECERWGGSYDAGNFMESLTEALNLSVDKFLTARYVKP